MNLKLFLFFFPSFQKFLAKAVYFLWLCVGFVQPFHASARELLIFIERRKSPGAEAEGNDTGWWLSASLSLLFPKLN